MTPADAHLQREIATAMGLAGAALEDAMRGCGEASASVNVSREAVRIEIFAHGPAGRLGLWTCHVDLPRFGEVQP